MGCLFGALAAKLTCRPIICSAIRDAKDNSTKVKYLKRFLANIADIYVSNTQAGFTNRFSLLKPHFRVVYNGVDFFRFDKQYDISSSLRNELCVSNFLHVVGMVGALSSNKDQDTLLSAATHILKKFPDTGFLFVGDGERREFLEKKAKILGIDKYVRFSGFRSDVDRLYNLMDVCVLLTNSQNHLEGIPNVLIEAMACNIPVVATVGGGTNEIVTHEKTGILVPPQDPLRTAKAIIDLLTDSDKAISMSLVACSWVHEMFNLERYTSDYENIYRELNFNNRSKLSN
jgi:glycosyltransferase involved in cell wall biosynthesis